MNKSIKNVGVDFDGVLKDIYGFQLKQGKQYFGEDAVVNEKGFEIKDMFACTKKQQGKFWLKNILKYEKLPLDEDVIEYINQQYDEGKKIYIITGHAHTTEKSLLGYIFRKLLENSLKEYGVKYHEIKYVSESNNASEKLEVCKSLNIDIMIEDKKENIEEISSFCPVIGKKNPTNEDVKYNSNIYMANNGQEMSDFTSKIELLRQETSLSQDNSSNEDNLNKEVKNVDYIPFKRDQFKIQYGIVRAIGSPCFQNYYNPTIIDREFIPKDGPVILCGNHLHVLDQFPVICSTKRTTHWMAKKEYFDGKLGSFFRHTGAISVDRFGDPSQSKLVAENYLDVGSAVGLFAEGTRNHLKREYIEQLHKFITSELHFNILKEQFIENITSQSLLLSQVQVLQQLLKSNRVDEYTFLELLLNSKEDCLIKLLINGTLTEEEYYDSLLLPFKHGAVSMSKKKNSLIVPFAVTGSYEKNSKDLTVRYDEPIDTSKLSFEEAELQLRTKILSLVKQNRNMH